MAKAPCPMRLQDPPVRGYAYGQKDPMPCRLCGQDTNVHGYNYGACNACVRRLVDRAAKDVRSYQHLYEQARREFLEVRRG